MGDEYACGGLIGERTWWGKNTKFLNFTVLVLLSWIESSAREWEWNTEWCEWWWWWWWGWRMKI
jgi:hypothetical protein